MDKTDLLRVRVTPRLKTDFEEICKTFGDKSSADMLRELVAQFVQANMNRLGDRVVVYISRPEGYDSGAWRVFIKLRDPEEAVWHGKSVPFPLPKIEKRRLLSDEEYRSIVGLANLGGYELGGVFINGEWRGHLYTNGVAEVSNPVPIDKVRTILVDHVSNYLDKFKPE